MIEQIFKHKSLNENKLTPFGFVLQNGVYTYETEILDGQFKMFVKVKSNGEIFTEVIDTMTNEPYTLHLVESASGSFVGSVRREYEAILSEVADKCFDREVFKSKQSHEIINYVFEKYGGELEFLWEKFDSNAIWRREDNKKWYGILLILSKRKLGINSDEVIEIIDLRAEPETIESIVDNKRFFAGYHMNKKHWITIPLDGTLPTEEIYRFIDVSYTLAKK